MDQIGRYQILDELGRGAHGVVYKALDPAIGRTVAIKTIAFGDIADEDRNRVREGILREARLAGTLSHPNIVTVYDVQDTGTSANIFMEFVDGKSLEWAISSTKAGRPDALNGPDFLSIIRQVAGALDYAHRKGIVHRDIKPANIVLTGRGQKDDATSGELVAKIADFGIAKFVSQEVTQSLTGTPNYMSPEQIQGVSLTGSSDQFSLAVIAYEILCGRKAFVADTMEALLYKIKNEREEPVDKVNPALSQTVRKVMQCAMAKNATQRFASCSEFAGALEFALGDSPKWTPGLVRQPVGGSAKSVAHYEEPDPEEAPQTGKRAALIAGLFLAVGLAIVLIVRMNSGPPVVTQVLDTRNAPTSPPPSSVEELKYDRHTPPPLNSNAGTKNPAGKSASATPVIPDESRTVAIVRIPKRREPPKRINQPSYARANGDIQFLTDPPGANLVVDGRSSCRTPCSLDLAGGRHTLTASMNGFGMTRKIFHVPEDPSVYMPMQRSLGVVVVSSEPQAGANVDVDGRSAGVTPVTLRLAPGTHRVSVWDGARWHVANMQVGADEVSTQTFHF